jgi:Na+-driven multidrug efflux pump
LGPEALAGVSLVFPLVMLMQTMSAGGMGGGVASAVARALCAGRRQDADALVVHALVIACVMATIFTTGALWGGAAHQPRWPLRHLCPGWLWPGWAS